MRTEVRGGVTRAHGAAVSAVVVVLAIVALACDGGTSAGRAADPTATQPALRVIDNAPSTGCGDSAAVEPGDHEQTMRHGGLQRSYILRVPQAYDGATPLPLVLNFHGFGSNARQQSSYSGLARKADREGFILVSPDATGNPQQQWNVSQLPNRADDVGFVRALLDGIEEEYCVDTSAVFAAGISNGSAFAQRLACVMPDRIIAVAAVAALVYPASCGADLPIAIIAFHGTDDACVPFGGGMTACGPRPLPVPAVNDAARDWARHDGCNLETAAYRRLHDDVRTIAYSECDAETAVVLFVIEGAGHTWPGAAPAPRLGPTTRSIDATDEMWAFFMAQAASR